ncbi:GNAT family N-acetyltransferase [Faecalibacterium sp. An121]|uniref:GNAT family N-acetyltransferase n=1 Tax=Faecalibacterium sp. An121 TaxID=1965550 RepID=UPI000B36C47F|nr:GNAT family N-acetyltransferase [Faecalibacterium sp. An121]OUQ40794.1 GNAT family N-acetyltransferase [Faecalibacterium sp. An121]
MRHAGTQEIETPRLLLRRIAPADAPAMYRNWASDPAVTRYTRWEPHKDETETFALLTAWDELYQNSDYYHWCLVDKATGEVFGTMSFCDDRMGEPGAAETWRSLGFDTSQGVWEPGYCIGRAWWGKGYTTEALRAAVDYWFTRTDSRWLACCHAVENPASGRVMQKAGFVWHHDDTYHKFDGTPVPCHTYLLTRDAWQTRKDTL